MIREQANLTKSTLFKRSPILNSDIKQKARILNIHKQTK